MTNTTTTPFDCAGEHVFQFGECIYCDTPEAQQAPLVIATRPNPIKVQVIAMATDGDSELVRSFEIPANQACEVTQRITPADLSGVLLDMRDFQQIDFRIEVPNIAMALTDQLIAASAEIDALRAANHAHSIASADLGRRAELAELLVDELVAVVANKTAPVELGHTFAGRGNSMIETVGRNLGAELDELGRNLDELTDRVAALAANEPDADRYNPRLVGRVTIDNGSPFVFALYSNALNEVSLPPNLFGLRPSQSISLTVEPL